MTTFMLGLYLSVYGLVSIKINNQYVVIGDSTYCMPIGLTKGNAIQCESG